MSAAFQALGRIPAEFIVFFIASLPISELRGAIPYALAIGISWQKAYIISVAGNFLPVIPILLFLGRISESLSNRYSFFDRFFTWLFERTRSKSELIERFEALGLILFVAIPLPVTGAWTGCAAAFIFRIPLRHAIPAIIAGIFISGTIVTLASLGVISFWGI
ncbi:MAG: small multi-drug export protein [Candidatus Krumholzibacteriota bacterium]|nr:small multi-drug export protein [Candidatus Krumholzibacteriota bacterium]